MVNLKNTVRRLLPSLLDAQRFSFCWFLEKGLLEELERFKMVRDASESCELTLSFKPFKMKVTKTSFEQTKRLGKTYGLRIYVSVKLRDFILDFDKKGKVFLGLIPLMTNEGTFLVNGVERVIINQIVRCPGVYYTKEINSRKHEVHTGTLISNRGVWIKFEIDENEVINVEFAKVKKLSGYVFLRTLGFTDSDILDKLDTPYYFKRTINSAIDDDDNKIETFDEAFLEFHRKFEPDEPPSVEGGQDLLYSLFFDPNRYDLGRVGRYRINKKFDRTTNKNVHILTPDDVLAIINGLIDFRLRPQLEDDIDHLGNRRIRGVGELLQDQVRIGMNRLGRFSHEQMTNNCRFYEKDIRFGMIINYKSLTSSIREFFSSSPLSQFMDQINPLAELTHKRRLSVFGAGGITGERVSFALRNINPSQYGRICPVETPEGPKAGLVGSLATYSRVNSYGFIETPFYKVEKGRVIKDNFPTYLDAKEEEEFRLAPGDVLLDSKNRIVNAQIPVRYRQEVVTVSARDVDYIAISPIQFLSLAASLIPFLEHDDANRILMGSNMQRQSVPLLYSEAPIVGTGFEAQVARDSGATIISSKSGKVTKINHNELWIKDNKSDKEVLYLLDKYKRSNQETYINQQSLLHVNEKVISGQVLADGPCIQGGELAVGQNILIAYMPWEGYNFEDAFVVSERLIYHDVFTSIHIEKYEIEVIKTKLGEEETTNDLPNVSDDLTQNLDSFGVVLPGTWVESGDILVGKLTPKEESPIPPEQRLLRSIFGGTFRDDVSNTSFTLPRRTSGRVLYVDTLYGNGFQRPVKVIKIYIAQKRKIQIGDKMAGRHGNKGVISKILPRQDMPFLPNGEPVDILLNPLGVPSRMNVGQIFECMLGLAGDQLNARFKVLPFDEMHGEEASRALVTKKLLLARKRQQKSWLFSPNSPGKVMLRDGITGQFFDNPIMIGKAYILKLVHLVDDKMHARSTGPYALVTQQPLGGKSHQGGQRLGEMEVWALEAFGAAYTLRELLTIKSDDMHNRTELISSIVKGKPVPRSGTPESFKVLIHELQALCLDISCHKINFGEDMRIEDSEINLMGKFPEALPPRQREPNLELTDRYLIDNSKFFNSD